MSPTTRDPLEEQIEDIDGEGRRGRRGDRDGGR